LKTKNPKPRAKHLPIILTRTCDNIRLSLELGDFSVCALKKLKFRLWQLITKQVATDEQQDLFNRVDIELSRHTPSRGIS
jgi:hypothetical protein